MPRLRPSAGWRPAHGFSTPASRAFVANPSPRRRPRPRYAPGVRLGVLDIGSNTVHLLVADVRPGGRPLATTSQRTVLRLMRYLDPDGSITEEGVGALVSAVAEARAVAESERVDELLATATS